MAQMTGAQALARSLVREGVEVVFALPGVQIMEAFNALYDEPSIRLVVVRHEQTAAYMADGYARSTGKPGVALVVPGPGALNATAEFPKQMALDLPLPLSGLNRTAPETFLAAQIHSGLAAPYCAGAARPRGGRGRVPHGRRTGRAPRHSGETGRAGGVSSPPGCGRSGTRCWASRRWA